MPDVLIRNIPAEDLDRLDEQARRVGLSRAEYVRRHLLREIRRVGAPVTVADLSEFSDLAADLEDADIMRSAWS